MRAAVHCANLLVNSSIRVKSHRSLRIPEDATMSWVKVDDYRFPSGWIGGGERGDGSADGSERSRHYCHKLEEGQILFFDAPPFDLPDADRQFLLSQKQSSFKGHKNVSYRPTQDLLRGGDAGASPEDAQRLHQVMRNYSQQVTAFLGNFLAPYAAHWKMDFASFRPLEEQNRDLSLHKRNDLMHVDAFPSRPTHGGRILRFFTNINPQRGRVWETTDGFDALAKSFAEPAGLKKIADGQSSAGRTILKKIAPVFKAVGVKGADRSAYDRFMLRFHDYLKENADYQQKWTKYRMEFPPGSCWIVYTDQVPHAVLSGQYAMEQTYIVPIEAMVAPELSPLRVLESMAGRALAGA
jgi:hypothetical protein